MPAAPDPLGRLAAVLDQLIPPEAPWPGAGAMGLAEAVLDDAEVDGNGETVDALLALLPSSFEDAAGAVQLRMLRAVEAEHAAAFGTLLRHAYNVYYSHPKVLAVLEAESGYPARPPLYAGYAMDPFDPAALATQRQRQPFWRKT